MNKIEYESYRGARDIRYRTVYRKLVRIIIIGGENKQKRYDAPLELSSGEKSVERIAYRGAEYRFDEIDKEMRGPKSRSV